MNVRLDFGTTARGPWKSHWEVDRPVEEILDEAGDGFIYIQRLIIQFSPFFAGLQAILKEVDVLAREYPEMGLDMIVKDALSDSDDLLYEALVSFAKERKAYHDGNVED